MPDYGFQTRRRRILAGFVLLSLAIVVAIPAASSAWAGRPVAVVRRALVLADPVTGETIRRLTKETYPSDGGPREPEWSRDSTKLAFARGYLNKLEIWVVRRDGTGLRQITDNRLFEEWPSWAPGSRRLVLSRSDADAAEDAELVIVRADGSGERRLTRNEKDEYCPVWSPDGRRIAFYRVEREGGQVVFNIYTIRPDGRAPKRIARGRGPTWSPNGRKILFGRITPVERLVMGPQEQGDLYVADRDGSNVQRLTDTSAMEYAWAWSPDGTKILTIESEDGFSFSIWVMNADGSDPKELVSGLHGHEYPSPSWSRDGERIVYVRDTGEGEDARRDLWSIRTDGSQDHRLRSTFWHEGYPDWWAGPDCVGAY